MNRYVLVNCLSLGVLVSACGGGATKPPEAPHDTSSSASAAPGPSSKGAEGPAAASSSSDVTKGIEAYKAGDLNGAKALFEVALQKNPKLADGHYYLGLVSDQLGNKVAAEKEYKAALEIQPDLVEASANLTALLVEAKKYDEAVAVAKKALDKNAKQPELLVNYATALSGKGDQAGAAKAFDDALKLKPNDARFVLTYAQQLAAWKKNDEAVAKLKQAAKLAGDDAGVLAEVGVELKGLKEFRECIAVMDKAVSLKDVAETRIYRAQCRLGTREKDAAVQDFQAAVQKEPNSAMAHYYLAGGLADSGKLKEAIAEWEQVLKLAPGGQLAKPAEQKIAKAKELLAKGGGKK